MNKSPTDPPGKRGRPHVAEPGSSVSTWVKRSEHDELIRLAQRAETTVSSLVRQLLKLRIR